MSDADYLISIGLESWVMGEDLPSGREFVGSNKQKLLLRGHERDDVWHIDEVREMSNELIEIKEKIKALEKREKELKTSLMEKMQVGDYIRSYRNVSNTEYIIEYIKKTAQPIIKMKAAIDFIKRNYGKKAAISFEENCTSVRKGSGAIYVRPFPKSAVNKKNKLSSKGPDISNDDLYDIPF